MKKQRILILLIILFPITTSVAKIISPAEMFGFRPGTNSRLLDFKQLLVYYETLARQSSQLQIDTLGLTTEGRPFPLITISSPQNLARLDFFEKIQAKIADPRYNSAEDTRNFLDQGKVIISVNCSIHSTEIGPSQMAPNFVFNLLTASDQATRQILDSTIILLLPVHNPDGLQKVVDWFRKYKGTKYEGGPLPWLYHRYSGHDINRDWYSLTQKEVQLTVEKIYRRWYPQIVIDLHQMGYYYARQFIPPYIPPIDPALHPLQLKQLETIGDTLLNRLTRSGRKGVANRAMYDAWTPARSFTFYYGGLRLLSETASCRIAAPVFISRLKSVPPGFGFESNIASANHPAPWSGGKWELSDIVSYQQSVVFETLKMAASQRRSFLNNYYQITCDAVQPNQHPTAYAISPKTGSTDAMYLFLKNLLLAGVEIQQTTESFAAKHAKLDSGTYIVQTAQPMRIFIKSLLENVPYPKIYQPQTNKLQPSYDITTHYLPLFYGLSCVALDTLPRGSLRKINMLAPKETRTQTNTPKWGYLVKYRSNRIIPFLNQLLAKKITVFQIHENFSSAGKNFSRGTLQIPCNPDSTFVETLARKSGIELHVIEAPVSVKTSKLRLPRLGLYQSWMASKDEGWTRFLLDQNQMPYQTLHNQDIQNTSLEDNFDVLIFTNQTVRQIYYGHSRDKVPPSYSGGIGGAGIFNLKMFVKQGGTIIFLNSATELALKYFDLKVENPLNRFSENQLYIPGAFLSLKLNQKHPLAYGYGNEVPVLFYHSPAFQLQEGNSIGFYENDSLCLSGLSVGAHHLKQLTGLAEISRGKGNLILFGFRPQFRAQTVVTFKLLFNAIYYSVAKMN